MKTVLTYGTFDLFHVGHVRILQRLRALGDRLVVGISSDEFNTLKGKKSFFSYEERAEIVESSKYVDFVFPEHNWEQKRDDIVKYQANVFGMGHDWQGKFDDLSDLCEVVYLERTEDISTTEIKQALSLVTPEQLNELERSIHSMVDVMNVILKTTNR